MYPVEQAHLQNAYSYEDQSYTDARQYSNPQLPSPYTESSHYALDTPYELPLDGVVSVSHMKRNNPNASPTSSQQSPSAILPSPDESITRLAEAPKRKSRQKPKIELAPDQPTTTQGKKRKRVYVACLQCRTRKIRCDGAKPACHNCIHRQNGNGECNYDSVPRRRGPDKMPGARQRMALREGDLSHRRRRRRSPTSPSDEPIYHQQTDHFPIVTEDAQRSHSPSSSSDYIQSPVSYNSFERLSPSYQSFKDPRTYLQRPELSSLSSQFYATSPATAQYDLSNPMIPIGGPVSRAYIVSADESSSEETAEDISYAPSLNFNRKTWYDSLCSLYAFPHSQNYPPSTRSQRADVYQSIASDLRFLFRTSNYWFSFFHVPTFFGNYFDPVKRESMQPSLILAALAISTFWQSSESGMGAEGRLRALRLRNEAQSSLEASINAGWIDETLAQAAWLLALFEICSHPEHSTARSVSSVVLLDSIIRSLALTVVDRGDPQATVFRPGDVPIVDPSYSPAASPSDCGYVGRPSTSTECVCQSLTLGNLWPSSLEHVPLWDQTPGWNPEWTEPEIKKESCRRLCWSSSTLTASHNSFAAANGTRTSQDLFIADPANYILLFSGESISRADASHSSKETIWALYDRCFLLWNSCVKMRFNRSTTDIEKAQFAIRTWLEADKIEAALNKHSCGLEKAFLFQGREYLFNTRMYITYEFQRFVPLATSEVNGMFHRRKAEEWLTHQAVVAERFKYGLHTITGNKDNVLLQRPFYIFWFFTQIQRSLALWDCDNTMTLALDVCKAFLQPIDYLSALWPSAENRRRYKWLRERLDAACLTAGVALPPPPNFTLDIAN